MPRWTWNGDELAPTRTVLVDVDGVLADGSHRQHLLNGEKKRWQDFFRAISDDQPLLATVTLVDLISDDTLITLLTARPESIHDDTVAWLREYEIRWDLLIMRGHRDHGPSTEMKRLAVEELRYAGFDPVLAIDDDQRNITMYEEENIPALYLHSGYYEA
jgi:hypothetical protein